MLRGQILPQTSVCPPYLFLHNILLLILRIGVDLMIVRPNDIATCHMLLTIVYRREETPLSKNTFPSINCALITITINIYGFL